MGNTLKSLALAASLLSASPDTQAQGVDARILSTKAALTKLADSLPTGYGAAKKVLGEDINLLEDGELSPSDADTIGKHAGMLEKVAEIAAKEVKSALQDNTGGQIAPVEAGAGQQLPPPIPKPVIGSKEDKELKRIEKVRGDMIQAMNKELMKKENWIQGPQGKAGISVSKKPTGIIFTYKDPKIKEGTVSPEGFANFRGQLIPGIYKVNIKTDANALIVWLTDPKGELLDMDGKPGKRITKETSGEILITVPDNATGVTFGFSTSLLKPEVTLSALSIEISDPTKNNNLAGK